jgi:GDP-4-dehydro-6-deoxy-D-mannose reductase
LSALAGPILITGAGGFAGTHLQAALAARSAEIHAFRGDVRDAAALEIALRAHAPTAIVHLAALSSVAGSWSAERETWDVNVGGTLNVVLATAAVAPDARILVVSSAEVYGCTSADEPPLRETHAVAPRSPYGRSKAAAEVACLRSDLDITVVRPFPHIGPRQDTRFAVASFADQIARIEAGEAPPTLRVGDLSAVRDYLDVRCVVDAYVRLLAADDPPRVVNVASGVGTPLNDVVARLTALARRPIEVEVDQARLRPSDIPRLIGDPSLLREKTGWAPIRALDDTLRDVLDDARTRVGQP